MNTIEFLEQVGLPAPATRPVDPWPFGIGRKPGATAEVTRPVSLFTMHQPEPTAKQLRKYEQPWHGNAIYMLASGKWTIKSAAEELGVGYKTLLDLAKNQWFQEKLLEAQRVNGAQDIMDVFRSECQNSAITLIELRDNQNVAPSVRRACAVDILDRFLGKPVQKIESKSEPTSADPVAEVARLELENARMRGQDGPSPAAA